MYNVIHKREVKHMSEEMKARSFRMTDETAEKFREFCSNFQNQNVALESLINAYEVQTATMVLTDRQTEITDYNAHIQALQSAFLNCLEVTENTEQRIRTEFKRQLTSKDEVILSLQTELDTAKRDMKNEQERAVNAVTIADERIEQYQQNAESLSAQLTEVQKQLQESLERFATAKEQLDDKNEIIRQLRSEIEVKSKCDEQLFNAEQKVIKAESDITALTSEVERLRLELLLSVKVAEAEKKTAIADVKEKYVSELDELRKQIQTLTEENYKLKIAGEQNEQNDRN